MIDLLELGTVLRAIFMTALFLLVTVNICCLPIIFTRGYSLPTKLVTVLTNVLGFPLLVIMSIGVGSFINGKEIPHFSKPFVENSEYALMYIVFEIAFFAFLAVGEIKYRKDNLTTASIKESLDHLPTGLCFSSANGTVQLVNHKMNELSYLITGEELQNANLFWRTLKNGEISPDVQRISQDNSLEFRLKNGMVYTFFREKVEHVFQITATDTTNLHKLTNRLIDNNEELEEMNERLRVYGETVDETTRARERLETKIRIHSELGQALLATRHCLRKSDADLQPVINAWKRNIAVLKAEAEPVKNTDLLKSLIDIANSTGITVELKGEFPEDDSIGRLLTGAATEALTNAVRHAGATTLFVEFSETDGLYSARYTNDGEAPAGEIREGGGLGSLRKKIERFGGEMEIVSSPVFSITVKLPKEVRNF